MHPIFADEAPLTHATRTVADATRSPATTSGCKNALKDPTMLQQCLAAGYPNTVQAFSSLAASPIIHNCLLAHSSLSAATTPSYPPLPLLQLAA